MPVDSERALETIVGTLVPHLGTTMAKAAVVAHSQKLGIDGGEISPEQIEALLHKILVGMSIFVGREKAVAISEEARAAVRGLGG
jgi:hypothetical protein